MKQILAALAFLAAGGVCVPAFAVEARITGWDELAPKPEAYDNPFAKLTPDQLRGLRKLLRHGQGAGAPSEDISAIRETLENQGLDIDWLFAQRKLIMAKREKLMTATNDSIVGATVRIPGYLLPLEFKDQKAVQFLLVPTVGACVHTPPPPPNQMVYVRYPTGFKITGPYSPIWITGRLETDNLSPDIGFIDGRRQVEVGYVMEADAVEPYTQNELRENSRPPSIFEAHKRLSQTSQADAE